MSPIVQIRLWWHQLSERWHRETAYMARLKVREAEIAAERAEAKCEEIIRAYR